MNVDFSFVHTAAEFTNGWAPFGFPVRAALDVTLLALVAVGFLARGYKLTRWAVRGRFKKSDPFVGQCSPVPDGPVMEPWTAAMQVAYEALHDGRPTYDPASHELHCPGLLVRFKSEDDCPDVAEVIGDPRPHECPAVNTTAARWTGHDLKKLLAAGEFESLCDEASNVRAAVIERDRDEANVEAAAFMAKARYQRRARIYEPGPDDTAEYELTAGNAPHSRPDKKPLKGGVNTTWGGTPNKIPAHNKGKGA